MLISRRTFCPQGFWYFESKTGWPKDAKAFFAGKTFDESVQAIIQHRLSNPRFANQWSTDPEVVAAELDRFCCLRLANDPNYCAGGAAVPQGGAPKKVLHRGLNSISGAVAQGVAATKRIVAGVGVMIDWLGDGLKPVSPELATRRAEVCAGCPQNKPGDLTSFFTIPASNLIRQQIEMKNEMKLSTPFDGKLGVCALCSCPLQTKVHTPIEHVLKHLKPEVKSQLPDFCWMLKPE